MFVFLAYGTTALVSRTLGAASEREAVGAGLDGVWLAGGLGLLAAWRYYQSGNVKLGMAALICAGFFIGGYLGASLVQNLPELLMKRTFGVFLMLVALKMIFTK